MKKVFLGLTAATILYAVYNVIIDIKDGVFDGLTIVGLVFLLLVAGVFAFLAWLFDGKSPVKRTAEQAKNIVKQEQEKIDAAVFDDMIRISVGIEDIEDLKQDFTAAIQNTAG